MKKLILSFIFCSFPLISFALNFNLSNDQTIVGDITQARVQFGDTFHNIARNNDIGYNSMELANPNYKPENPPLWYNVTVPQQFILPNVKKLQGIIINLPEMRLYYFPENQNAVYTFPIGIGQPGWQTPQGKMRVIEKIANPSWYVPKSIQKNLANRGIQVADVVPPGDANPLGHFAMRLTNRNYLIHGTNVPDSIGMRSSSGCIRLYPQDIQSLFAIVPPGTPVKIIDEPFKIGFQGNEVYLQAYPELAEDQTNDPNQQIQAFNKKMSALIEQYHFKNIDINWDKVKQVFAMPSGIPQVIGIIQ